MRQYLFRELAELKQQKKDIEQQIKEKSLEVTTDMINENAEEVETSLGKFQLQTYRTWVYPDEIKETEKEIKARKKEAEANGDASYEEHSMLKFYPAKSDAGSGDVSGSGEHD